MNTLGNTPVLSSTEESKAPWNDNHSPHTIPVTVVVTLSKTVDIEIDSYEVDDDGEGNVTYNIPHSNLVEAVENQIELPQENPKYEDWCVDSFEVIEE